jgi:hypothetical protein
MTSIEKDGKIMMLFFYRDIKWGVLVLKRFLLLLLVFSFAFMSTGCGMIEKVVDAGKEKGEKAAEESGEDTAEAIEPNESYKELEFNRINWIGGAPSVEQEGGIWVYTKDKHPAGLGNQDWDHEDILYIQASSDYEHQDIVIRKLQVISDDVVKIVVDWEKDIGRDAPPRDWAKVETGLLQGKKFIVEDTSGEKVKFK